MFDPAGYDFHLRPASPAIEAGVDSGIAHDHDGNPRPMDGDDDGTAIADIGAYEYPGIYVPPVPDTTPPSIPVSAASLPTSSLTSTFFFFLLKNQNILSP